MHLPNNLILFKSLREQYLRFFSSKDSDKPLRIFKASVNLKDDVQPVFYKSYRVPYVLWNEVNQELLRLESDSIINKVKSSIWWLFHRLMENCTCA